MITFLLTFVQNCSFFVIQERHPLYAPDTPSLKPSTRAEAGVSPRNATRPPYKRVLVPQC